MNEQQTIAALVKEMAALDRIFQAVDDFFFKLPDGGYPEGHFNPDALPALHEAFLEVANTSRSDLVIAAMDEAGAASTSALTRGERIR